MRVHTPFPVRLAIGLLMIFPLFGFSGGKDYPKENWYLVEARLPDGRPAVGTVNAGYQEFPHKIKYPWSLRLHIALNLDDVTPNGLPLEQEKDIGQQFEDELVAALGKLTVVHNVGHLYNDGFLDVYLYLAAPEKAHAYLQQRIENKDHTRGFAYEMSKDPHWTEVEFLFRKVD